MKVNKYLIGCFILFFMNEVYLNGQVQLGLFSYSEFFYSPNESYGDLRSFYKGYNKYNFSSHLGIAISFKITDKLSVSVGGQKINRQFDCNCVKSIIKQSNVYYISDSLCELQLKSVYKILQLPVSIKYSFSSKNKKNTHSIGLSNAVIYNLGRQNLLYHRAGSLDITYGKKLLSLLSPEIFYELDVLLLRHTYANFAFGIREEITKQFNHALFGKVGISYSIEKDKHRHKRVF